MEEMKYQVGSTAFQIHRTSIEQDMNQRLKHLVIKIVQNPQVKFFIYNNGQQ